MCGIIATVNVKVNLNKALQKMAYRGYQEKQTITKVGNVQVAHTRLPIVDLSPDGDQPAQIANAMGWLVGEVFNFKEFSHSSTDTKAMLEVFLVEGLQGFHKFDGFWTFVTIYQGKVFAATDYLSQKPLYYRTDIKAIASEPVALLELGHSPFDEVFFSNIQKWGYDMTGRTPWENIKQLPAGHYWYDGIIKPYWDWKKIPVVDFKTAVIEATQNRLLGDQPIACLLSGGLDSSIVFALSKELGANLRSFHIENDETHYAKLVDPNTRALSLKDVLYANAIKYHQSPVDLGSVLPQAILSQAVASEGYHVCLTGDGADEICNGYKRSENYDSQQSDIFVELPYYHLPRLDKLMMKNTIELRTPFLSPKVIKAVLAIPYEQRKNKQPLKDAFGYLLPPEIINRPKKALKIATIENGTHSILHNINLFKEIYQ